MNFFEDGHMTRAAQILDQRMAAEGLYWDAQITEYRHADQDTPGKDLVVHYLPPGEIQIEPVTCAADFVETDQVLEVA